MTETSKSSPQIRRGNLVYLPVVPGRLEWALHVRRKLLEQRPAVVAIELPSSLEKEYRGAIERLPRMSVILLSAGSVYDEEEEPPIYLPVEPGDAFVEALRTAGEIGADVVFLEPGAEETPHAAGIYPAPSAVESIGMESYLTAYRVHPPERNAAMQAHAAAMAWKLQGCDPLAETCIVISLNILDPLLDAMEFPQEAPAPRPRGSSRAPGCSICIRIAWPR